jgi:predicted enzyme related to lactoylglutathione lyase
LWKGQPSLEQIRPFEGLELIAPDRLLSGSAPVKEDRAMTPASSNPVVHLELHTGDRSNATAFYAQLCDWRAERIDAGCGSYLALEMGGGLSGGIVECETRRPLWLPYVEVAEIAEATERARLLGASVLLEPREGPAGWRSVVAAHAGGEIAFWQPKR